jgi:hypothetical protein
VDTFVLFLTLEELFYIFSLIYYHVGYWFIIDSLYCVEVHYFFFFFLLLLLLLFLFFFSFSSSSLSSLLLPSSSSPPPPSFSWQYWSWV